MISKRTYETIETSKGNLMPVGELMNDRRYLSTSEAAAYVGLGESSLERLRMIGGGPVFFQPTPRRVLYAIEELDEWLHSRSHQSTAEYAPAAVC